jgi:hypothetical protein
LRATESKEDRERDAREKAVSGDVKPRKVNDKKKADAKPAALLKPQLVL